MFAILGLLPFLCNQSVSKSKYSTCQFFVRTDSVQAKFVSHLERSDLPEHVDKLESTCYDSHFLMPGDIIMRLTYTIYMIMETF